MQVTREIQWFRVHDSLWSKSNTATRFNSRKRISETWLTSTTLWSCSCWMIKSHTVVFPDAVPPETPDPRRERKSNRGTHKHHIHMPLDFSPMRKCRKIIVINVSSFFYICKIKSIVRECKEQEKQRTEAVMFMYICMISLSFLLIKNNMYDKARCSFNQRVNKKIGKKCWSVLFYFRWIQTDWKKNDECKEKKKKRWMVVLGLCIYNII